MTNANFSRSKLRRQRRKNRVYGHPSLMSIHGSGVVLMGNGFLDDMWSFGKKAKDFLYRQGKVIAPELLRQLGPHVLSIMSAKAAEKASKAGVPDKLVNAASKAAQKESQRLAKKKPNKNLNENQRLVSDVISSQAEDLFSSILSKGSGVKLLGQGKGVNLHGAGVNLHGSGVKLHGQGINNPFQRSVAPKI